MMIDEELEPRKTSCVPMYVVPPPVTCAPLVVVGKAYPKGIRAQASARHNLDKLP